MRTSRRCAATSNAEPFPRLRSGPPGRRGIKVNLPQQRILVTGGAGFLGGHIVEELERAGCRQTIVVRSSEYDLRDPRAVAELFRVHRPGVVIHAAAVVGGIGAN